MAYVETATLLPNGTEAGPDVFALAPEFETIAPELAALVRDQVFEDSLGLGHRASQQGADFDRRRLFGKRCETHHAPGIVIDGNRQPPAERPALQQSSCERILIAGLTERTARQ